MSVNVRMLMSEESVPEVEAARIERVSQDDPHTLVVKLGGASACLHWEGEISAAVLLRYCRDQMGWKVEDQPFVVDGERYEAGQADRVMLSADTQRIDVGQTNVPTVMGSSPRLTKPSVFEVTRELGSKGLSVAG